MSGGFTRIVCAHCGAAADKLTGGVNRSIRKGVPLFCSKACVGLRHRHGKSSDQLRAEKAEYDRRRRDTLGDTLKAEKRAAYHAAVAADPVGARAREKEIRRQRMPKHVEYCRRPEYRKWKAEYDQKYCARKQFGAFGEAAIILNQLETEIFSRATRTEIARANGTLNKSNERKRDYARQTGHAQRG